MSAGFMACSATTSRLAGSAAGHSPSARKRACRRLEGYVWDSLGYAEHHLGNLHEAATCYQRSLRILPEFGDRYGEAATLTHLGDTWHAAGELPRARDAWQKAFTILDDLRLPDADEVRVKLASIDRQMS